MEQLAGKTAVITGGASGMGRAFADRFGADGMNLVLADVEVPALDAAVEELTDAGYPTLGVTTDVTRADDFGELAAAASDRFGDVHVICLNAGVGGGMGPIESMTLADWEWVLGVNLWGIVNGLHTFLPGLKQRGEGHVVITASIAGHTSYPHMAAYNASKHAAVTIAETLFAELRDAGSDVGVTCLCPGFVRTNIITSDRNRPEHLRRPPMAEEEVGRDDGSRAATLDIFQSTTPPSAVADLIHDAVVDKTFYVFTDELFTAPIRARHEDIAQRRSPSTPGSILHVYLD